MPPVRACEQCRAVKAKCDLTSPVCGRCMQRSLGCSGPADLGILFLNENKTAQRNSRLARRWRSSKFNLPGRVLAIPSHFPLLEKSLDLAEDAAVETQRLYYWLNETALAEVPGPLKRDIETRAIERFFLNWTLNPTNDGVAPGYMHNLPALYGCSPSGSILWFAVRAVAFADRKEYGGESFSFKARQNYGAALTRMRRIAHDNQKLAEDRTLAALLLIDTFELMYLARSEPLGLHKEAISHILDVRGEAQLYDRSHFELWRMAIQRLQVLQLLHREEPNDNQLALLSKLNMSLPDIHICADVMRAIILCAAAKRLVQEGNNGFTTDNAEQAEGLAEKLACTMRELIASMESWTSEVGGAWKAKAVDRSHLLISSQNEDWANVSPPVFALPNVLSYNNIWLAYKWNLHVASQIVLRESLVEILEYSTELQQSAEPGLDHLQCIHEERVAVERLSSAIVASFPPLLGLMEEDSHQGTPPYPQGKMAGMYFALCAMSVIQRARFTSAQHKQTATEVLQWINKLHQLA